MAVRRSSGRLIACLAATQILSWGTLYYSFGVLWEEIGAGAGWPVFALLLGFSCALTISGVFTPGAAGLFARFGGRRIMTAGSLLSGLALALIALGTTPAVAAGWILAGLAMPLTLYEAAFAVVAEQSDRCRERVIVLITLAGGFAGTVFLPLTAWLSARWGWQHVLLAYSGLHWFVAAPLHWAAIPRQHPRQTWRERPAASRSTEPAMQAFTIAFSLNAAVFAAISTLLVLMLERAGIARSQAASLAALIGPAQVAARVALLIHSRPDRPHETARLVFILLPISLAGLVASLDWPFGIVLALGLYGACNGASTIARTSLIHAWDGPSSFVVRQARLSAPSIAARALGPLAAVILMERNPDPRFVLAIAVALAAAASVVFHRGVRRLRPFTP
jgi:MFS family permease